MGTPVYMSPEQCRGAGDVDHHSDIYALGCVLFHLLTGKPPFDADGVGLIIAAHLSEPPPAPSSHSPGIPAEVDGLVLRCLAKQPGERYPSMGDLAAAIDAVMQYVAPGSAPGLYASPAVVGGPSYSSRPPTDGQLMLTLHQPNSGAPARAKLFTVEETADSLKIAAWKPP